MVEINSCELVVGFIEICYKSDCSIYERDTIEKSVIYSVRKSIRKSQPRSSIYRNTIHQSKLVKKKEVQERHSFVNYIRYYCQILRLSYIDTRNIIHQKCFYLRMKRYKSAVVLYVLHDIGCNLVVRLFNKSIFTFC